ncbi:stalk domain-containing protein [Paenibacillus sp. J2TS4]|uniref:stalk domain-containing protein n=1 Tax=Paenibacillus sp. J2TS4 TaxID=2807194 RepID=UPI001B0B7B18|nr:DUF4163 domain-containing protein [Paenibacillus sp. J2TS4]GIP34156.1 hypothetical protein J2TS4_33660 [Paenibacillus sp. J2TS4]
MKSSIKLLSLGIASCLLISGSQAFANESQQKSPAAQPVPATVNVHPNSVQLTSKTVQSKTDEMVIDVTIPVLEGLKDKKYQEQLNDTIYQQIMEDQAALEKEAKEAADFAKEKGYEFRPFELKVTYELKSSGGPANSDIVSLKVDTYIYTGGANGMPRVDTYNVMDKEQASRIELEDLLGSGYKEKADTFIRQEIAQDPDMYFEDEFTGISDNQTFYIEDGHVVVVFGKYEIAPGAAGTPEFRIPMDRNATAPQPEVKQKEFTLEPDQAYTDNNGITMVPLRVIAENLGYTVEWNNEQRQAELSQGAQWTAVQLGNDRYFYNKMAPVTLGAAPVILEDQKMYVPLDFFSKIIRAEVSTEETTGAIHISLDANK